MKFLRLQKDLSEKIPEITPISPTNFDESDYFEVFEKCISHQQKIMVLRALSTLRCQRSLKSILEWSFSNLSPEQWVFFQII